MITNDQTIRKPECERVRPAESRSGGSESEAALGYPVYRSLTKQDLKEPIKVRIYLPKKCFYRRYFWG